MPAYCLKDADGNLLYGVAPDGKRYIQPHDPPLLRTCCCRTYIEATDCCAPNIRAWFSYPTVGLCDPPTLVIKYQGKCWYLGVLIKTRQEIEDLFPGEPIYDVTPLDFECMDATPPCKDERCPPCDDCCYISNPCLPGDCGCVALPCECGRSWLVTVTENYHREHYTCDFPNSKTLCYTYSGSASLSVGWTYKYVGGVCVLAMDGASGSAHAELVPGPSGDPCTQIQGYNRNAAITTEDVEGLGGFCVGCGGGVVPMMSCIGLAAYRAFLRTTGENAYQPNCDPPAGGCGCNTFDERCNCVGDQVCTENTLGCHSELRQRAGCYFGSLSFQEKYFCSNNCGSLVEPCDRTISYSVIVRELCAGGADQTPPPGILADPDFSGIPAAGAFIT